AAFDGDGFEMLAGVAEKEVAGGIEPGEVAGLAVDAELEFLRAQDEGLALFDQFMMRRGRLRQDHHAGFCGEVRSFGVDDVDDAFVDHFDAQSAAGGKIDLAHAPAPAPAPAPARAVAAARTWLTAR